MVPSQKGIAKVKKEEAPKMKETHQEHLGFENLMT
jgi:hypothetical protein